MSIKYVLAAAALVTASIIQPTASKAAVYIYSASSGTGNDALNAQATITTNGSAISVVLENLLVNQRSNGQSVSGIEIFFKNAIGATSGLTQSGQLVDIAPDPGLNKPAGTAIFKSGDPTHWRLSAANPNGLDLSTFGNGPNPNIGMIIGAPAACAPAPCTGLYSNANMGLQKNFEPFIFETGTFTFTVAGLTGANLIDHVAFQFGTQPDTTLAGALRTFTPDPVPNNPPAVPEPATWAMMMLGFLGMGLIAYRRRTPATQLRMA